MFKMISMKQYCIHFIVYRILFFVIPREIWLYINLLLMQFEYHECVKNVCRFIFLQRHSNELTLFQISIASATASEQLTFAVSSSGQHDQLLTENERLYDQCQLAQKTTFSQHETLIELNATAIDVSLTKILYFSKVI